MGKHACFVLRRLNHVIHHQLRDFPPEGGVHLGNLTRRQQCDVTWEELLEWIRDVSSLRLTEKGAYRAEDTRNVHATPAHHPLGQIRIRLRSVRVGVRLECIAGGCGPEARPRQSEGCRERSAHDTVVPYRGIVGDGRCRRQ